VGAAHRREENYRWLEEIVGKKFVTRGLVSEVGARE
jgi:hypothetical protein